MKTDAQYKKDERARKKAEGKKRAEFWIYPVDFTRISQYVHMVTEETKINKNNA